MKQITQSNHLHIFSEVHDHSPSISYDWEHEAYNIWLQKALEKGHMERAKAFHNLFLSGFCFLKKYVSALLKFRNTLTFRGKKIKQTVHSI